MATFEPITLVIEGESETTDINYLLDQHEYRKDAAPTKTYVPPKEDLQSRLTKFIARRREQGLL